MVTLKIKFDAAKALEHGVLISEVLSEIDRFFRQYPSVKKISEGVWQDDSENGVAVSGKLAVNLAKNHAVFHSLESMIRVIDGMEEDCIEEVLKWNRKYPDSKL